MKIKGAIAREWKRKGQNVDWELLERMEMHQKGVEAAIAHQFSSPGECMFVVTISRRSILNSSCFAVVTRVLFRD